MSAGEREALERGDGDDLLGWLVEKLVRAETPEETDGWMFQEFVARWNAWGPVWETQREVPAPVRVYRAYPDRFRVTEVRRAAALAQRPAPAAHDNDLWWTVMSASQDGASITVLPPAGPVRKYVRVGRADDPPALDAGGVETITAEEARRRLMVIAREAHEQGKHAVGFLALARDWSTIAQIVRDSALRAPAAPEAGEVDRYLPAIAAWLDYGRDSYRPDKVIGEPGHTGYFGPGGWAYEQLLGLADWLRARHSLRALSAAALTSEGGPRATPLAADQEGPHA